MTAAESKSIQTREGTPFTFTVDGAAFCPPSGAVLHFASMDVDTLTLPGLPYGLVSRGSVVTVSYNGLKVFQGTPASRVERWGRGTTHYEDVTFEGPWGNLNRYVFRQEWGFKADQGGTAVTLNASNAHVVLNLRSDGVPQNMTDQVREIAAFAAGKCRFSYSAAAIDAGTQILPADEACDITCAAAIVRTLRFFPKMLARFDYSDATPVLNVLTPESTDSGWMTGVNVLSRSITRKDHPVVGVEISTSNVNTRITVGDQEYDTRRFETQSAGDTDSLDCLHLYIPLARGRASSDVETLDCTGHIKDLWNVSTVKGSVFFWKHYHPRLKDIAQGSIKIDSGSVKVVDPLDPGTTVTPYKYVTDLTVGDLRHFGQDAVACRFVCKAKITTEDDVEEDVVLTMDFVTTNATQRTYTQMVGMSSEAGDSLPDNLAQAILDQRAGELESEDIVVRLPLTLPQIGLSHDGLFLQNMSIDCQDLTAELHFGHPNYLSAEEMRDLLSGFRGRSYTSSSVSRDDTEPDSSDAEETSGIQPISSTEFCPGKKSKTTIKGDSGSIVLDSKKLESGETAKIREITIYDKDGNPSKLKVVGTEPVPGEAEPDDEEDEADDPHDQDDPHGDGGRDPCNPSGDSEGPGDAGGGAGIGAGPGDHGEAGQDVPGGAGVNAGENPGDGESAPGCPSDNC